MKKTMASVMALGLAAAVAYGQATEVKSVNVVGFAKRSVPTGFSMWGIAFEKVGAPGDGFTLDELIGSSLAGAQDPFTADNVLTWDSSAQQFKLFWYYDDGANKGWLDGSGDLANVNLKVGDAFFIQRRSEPVELALMGEVVNVQTGAVDIVQGLNMVSYPFSSSKDIQTSSLKSSGAQGAQNPFQADNLLAWDDASQAYVQYWLYDDGEASGWLDSNGDLAALEMTVGSGYWFERKGTTGFQWQEVAPYNL